MAIEISEGCQACYPEQFLHLDTVARLKDQSALGRIACPLLAQLGVPAEARTELTDQAAQHMAMKCSKEVPHNRPTVQQVDAGRAQQILESTYLHFSPAPGRDSPNTVITPETDNIAA